MADNLSIHAKNLAESKASSSAMTAVIGRLIGVLEAYNIDITDELNIMFSVIKQGIVATRDKSEQPQSEIVQYFLDCYIKEIDDIQSQRDSSRTKVEERLKAKSAPEV